MLIKIKTWDEMENEFGLNEQGNVLVKFRFTKYMEDLMPRSRIIKVQEVDKRCYDWRFQGVTSRISEGMIELFIRQYSIYGERINICKD